MAAGETDPERNVDYAARFLKQLYDRERNWTRAVARYHAGDKNTPAQKRYVCAVIGKLVQARLGGWTPEARAFCGVKNSKKKRRSAANHAESDNGAWATEILRSAR